MDVILADWGMAFDGASRATRPMGGAEAAFCALAEGFAARGHRVVALTRTDRRVEHAGVSWQPADAEAPKTADLYIANRSPRLLGVVPRARRRVLWLHNPAGYLKKPKFLGPLLRWRPDLVVLGAYHASTVPWFVPRRSLRVIPHAVAPEWHRTQALERAPGPIAVFTSNPERGLCWLVDLWTRRIAPRIPGAELHAFCGSTTYGGHHAARIEAGLERSRAAAGPSVRFRTPLPPEQLRRHLGVARLMPYPGDPGETFCLAAAEAQAIGIPLVTKPVGAMPERLVDRETGLLASDDEGFAEACVQLLTDDALWHAQHRSAICRNAGWTWNEVAAAFEAI